MIFETKCYNHFTTGISITMPPQSYMSSNTTLFQCYTVIEVSSLDIASPVLSNLLRKGGWRHFEEGRAAVCQLSLFETKFCTHLPLSPVSGSIASSWCPVHNKRAQKSKKQNKKLTFILHTPVPDFWQLQQKHGNYGMEWGGRSSWRQDQCCVAHSGWPQPVVQADPVPGWTGTWPYCEASSKWVLGVDSDITPERAANWVDGPYLDSDPISLFGHLTSGPVSNPNWNIQGACQYAHVYPRLNLSCSYNLGQWHRRLPTPQGHPY